METRAHHVLIGSFVLMMIAGLIGFIYWAVKADVDRQYDSYTIYFDSAVTGLSTGGAVRLNGILVGEVSDIRFDDRTGNTIQVTIQVYEGTPINTDSKATLEVQLLTGISYVQILNRPAPDGKPPQPLTVAEGEPYPVIPAETLGLQDVVQSASKLVDEGIQVLKQANKLFSDENIAAVSGTLADVKAVTGTIAGQRGDVAESLILLRQSMTRIDAILADVEGVTDEDLPLLVADIRSAVGNVDELTGTLNAMVEENRPAISNFTQGALPELTQFATDARRLSAVLLRIAERLDASPADFIFSPKKPEIEAPKQ